MGVLREELRRNLTEAGAVLVGFADLKDCKDLPYPALTCAVSYAVAINPRIAASIADGPTQEYEAEYDRLNALISHLAEHAKACIRRYGFKAEGVPSTNNSYNRETLLAGFPHKTAAVLAGLGWIGKNDLFVTEQYGCAVRIGTVFTDATFPTVQPMESRCGNCTLCCSACPASAPLGRNWHIGAGRENQIDIFACDRQLQKWKELRGLKYSICGVCIAKCMWTRRWLASEGYEVKD
ncbi:MAG: epoxyqueuosine reductase [Pyramidobacter sp.]|nr:epoxyqueuosine reductase [Pyramidobacter sp.]